jgi:hypothetical protein
MNPSTARSPKIVLNDGIDTASLKILLENGNLWERCGMLKRDWNDQLKRDKTKLEEGKKREKESRRKAALKDTEMIERNIGAWIAKQAAIHYT